MSKRGCRSKKRVRDTIAVDGTALRALREQVKWRQEDLMMAVDIGHLATDRVLGNGYISEIERKSGARDRRIVEAIERALKARCIEVNVRFRPIRDRLDAEGGSPPDLPKIHPALSPGEAPTPIQSLPWLDVCLDRDDGTIFKQKKRKLIFWFINKSSRAVTIRYPVLERCRIPLHSRSWKDMTRGAYELKFMSKSGWYDAYEFRLRPNGRCETAIYPKRAPSKAVLSFQPSQEHQERDDPKFFVLRYTVVSDHEEFAVRTVY